MRHDSLKCREESIDLALPAVKLLGYQQAVRGVMLAQREWIYATMRLPFRRQRRRSASRPAAV